MTTQTTIGVPAPVYAPGNIGYFQDMTMQKAAGLLMKCAKNYRRGKHGRFGPKVQSAHKKGVSRGRFKGGKVGRVSITTGRK